uniref:Uncharacterized protein n=1 Tax=Chromera velia CCMP2878 TaxID=1169474 RepID=A0A0G4HK02_9ALVE|eukprot:Cvel_7141.t1-p1 / transcript=Cvel_7141.t1 / gene=Cvel_7141 / organism=Chromera_velia_CCMP2878 / gene_product=hypothetical protein / transcript_product=hypothetical protein / location=Cvel_scaffold366:90730-92855(+) / protein_length=435 / sequence_SO=supercontig / SO=protein_coding / is_pseudo=false
MVERIANCISLGGLVNLESLDVGGNRWRGRCLDPLGRALRKETVPDFKDLNLGQVAYIVDLAEGVRVGNFSGLKSLQLNTGLYGRVGMEALMGAIVESEDGLPFARALDFSNSRAGEGGASLGAALLSGKLRSLYSIDMRNSGLTDEGLGGLAATALINSPQISSPTPSLSLRSIENTFTNAPPPMATAIPLTPSAPLESQKGLLKLKYLHLSGTSVGGPAASALLSALLCGKLPVLEGVDPGEFRLDQNGVAALADVVRVSGRYPICLRPVVVRLSPNPPSPINIGPLFIAIAESQASPPGFLDSLSLTGGRVGEEAIASLAAIRPRGASFERKSLPISRLDLSDCGLDDRLLERLALVCNFPNLQFLDLSRNNISVGGLSSFFEAASFPKLRKLVLSEEGMMKGAEQKEKFISFLRDPKSGRRLSRCSIDVRS